MATKSTEAVKNVPQNEDPNSPFEGVFHLLRRCVHGHDTDLEAVCHYQDVFGHSCEEELEAAANGELKDVFYRLYDCAYGTVQMVNFDRRHSNYCKNLRDEIAALESDVDDCKAEEERLRKEIQNRDRDIADAAGRINDLKKENEKLFDMNHQKEAIIGQLGNEILKLKAMLWDMQQEVKK